MNRINIFERFKKENLFPVESVSFSFCAIEKSERRRRDNDRIHLPWSCQQIKCHKQLEL